MQAHACACTFNVCKTSKTGVCTHCCTQFWRAHSGQWTHATHEKCTSWARTWFATLHVSCNSTHEKCTSRTRTWFVTLHVSCNSTHEKCTSQAHTWFATLHVSCNYRYSSCRQWNATVLQLIGFFICCNEYRSKVLMKGHVHTEYARISSCHEWTRSSIVQRKNYLQLWKVTKLYI